MTEHVIYVVVRQSSSFDVPVCWRHTEDEARTVVVQLGNLSDATYRVHAVSDVPDELKPKPVDPLADLVVTIGCEAVHPGNVGRQHVAKQCTGVRIRHVPTGLEVVVNSERSQHANRAKAAREMITAMCLRQPDGISVRQAIIDQLMEWAGHAKGRPPTVLDNLDMTAPAVPLTAEQREDLARRFDEGLAFHRQRTARRRRPRP